MGVDQYTPRELVDTTVTLTSEGGTGGLKAGITPRSEVGLTLPATSSNTVTFPIAQSEAGVNHERGSIIREISGHNKHHSEGTLGCLGVGRTAMTSMSL